EVQLAVQQLRHRTDRIVDIVVAEHDEPGGDEEYRLRRDRGCRARRGEGRHQGGTVNAGSAESRRASKLLWRRSPESESTLTVLDHVAGEPVTAAPQGVRVPLFEDIVNGQVPQKTGLVRFSPGHSATALY